MRLFKRRHAPEPAVAGAHEPRCALDGSVTAVVVVDEDQLAAAREVDAARAAAAREAAWKALRRVVAEAVIRQDQAEELLADIREREPLARLAPRGGRLVSRFVALRRELPDYPDPALRRHVGVLERVFDHHALMLTSSLDLLAVGWRSERLVDQLERIDGLGAPAEWLEAVRAQLREPEEAR